MTVTEQFKSKTEALRTVQSHINELITLKRNIDCQDLHEINRYIDGMITSYKKLAAELREKFGKTS